MTNRSVLATLVAIAGALAGCGSTAESICDRACECTGCNADQRADCTNLAEDAELDAEQTGCLGEYDDLLACYDSSFECVNNVPTYEGCAGELVNLIECEGGQPDG
ncbi:MAG: hypothetical protein JNK04_14440 [Myxococcales bacterium]|nr:hypothetical protein [Myxococcales bacterium]